VVDSCVQGNEPSRLIKAVEFRDWLSDYKVLKDSAPGTNLNTYNNLNNHNI